MREPIADAAGWTAEKAATSRAACCAATPRHAHRACRCAASAAKVDDAPVGGIIEDRPITIDDLPATDARCCVRRLARMRRPARRRAHEGPGDTYAWVHGGEDPASPAARARRPADQIEYANNYERRLRNWFDPQTDAASEPFATLPPAEGGDLSSRVVDVIEGGPPLEGGSQGAQAQRFAGHAAQPGQYDLACARSRSRFRTSSASRRARPARRRVRRAEGCRCAPACSRPLRPGRRHRADRRRAGQPRAALRATPARRGWALLPAPAGARPDGTEHQRADGDRAYRRARSRARTGRRCGSSAGCAPTPPPASARVLEEGTSYNKYAPDVLRTHVQADAAHRQRAGVRRQPVKIRAAPGGGAQDMIVGEHAAAQLEDLFNRRDMKVYDAYVGALQERYARRLTPTPERRCREAGGRAAWPCRAPSSRRSGQMPTGAIMAGGLKNVGARRGHGRGPVLRDVFRIGAQSHEFTDYAALATGSTAAQHSALFHEADGELPPQAGQLRCGAGDPRRGAGVRAHAEANQPSLRALVKRAAEMGTTPEALGTEFISTDGVLSHRTWPRYGAAFREPLAARTEDQ